MSASSKLGKFSAQQELHPTPVGEKYIAASSFPQEFRLKSIETVLLVKDLECRGESADKPWNKKQSCEETGRDKNEDDSVSVDGGEARYRYCNMALLLVCLVTLAVYHIFLFVMFLETRICPNRCMPNIMKFFSS